jgi:putative FmdB family regulatory protein
VPTYQYACTACGEQLEAVQSFTDEPLTECPACSGRLRKLFSSVGVVFKGSGFYRTDSREKPASEKPAAEKSTTEKSTPSSSDSTKSESSSSSSSSSSAKSDSSTSSSSAPATAST